MSSPTNGKMDVDRPTSPDRRSKSSRNHSTETHRTRKSHRSRSRDRDRERRDRRREREDPEEIRRSRDRRSRERHRDRDYDRERERDRDRRRERDGERHRSDRERSDRDREREDREYREKRRRREDDDVLDERSKRKRDDDGPDSTLPAPPPSAGLPPPPPPLSDSPRRRHGSGDPERRYGDRPPRPSRDPRDEFDDGSRHPRASVGRETPHEPEKTRRTSPSYDLPPDDPLNEEPREDDSEARSVFVSQLAARLTARDLGYFFEDKLGEGTVMDSRIVTDRISRRSKGIGYVEFRTVELVDKAIALSGTVVMGLPIQIQHTEAERNKLHAGDTLNLPPGVSAPHGGMQLYVGSLHFNLTESDIKQVFEPFGELEFVDLHRDPMTGRSKGYAFVQYKRAEDAKMALEQMEGFELAGRTLRVNTVHEKGTVKYTQQDSLDEAGGGNLNAASRQALMQKLARIDQAPTRQQTITKPNIPVAMQSRSVLLKNMFDPEEETDPDWDKELAEDCKIELDKYGRVEFLKVEKESQGEIYVKYDTVESAKRSIDGLNGRWFGSSMSIQGSSVIHADVHSVMQEKKKLILCYFTLDSAVFASTPSNRITVRRDVPVEMTVQLSGPAGDQQFTRK